MGKRKSLPAKSSSRKDGYAVLVSGLTGLLEESHRAAARSVNAVMTATYWEIGRRIVEYEQRGEKRAEYGAALLKRLAVDLTGRFGRGFSERNLEQMRLFYLGWPISQTVSAKSRTVASSKQFPLPWSHYVRLLAVKDIDACAFYETEALRGGWSVRQLDRQISTLFYERTALSRDKADNATKGEIPEAERDTNPGRRD